MISKKALVAYDGSASSHKALDIAREIAATNPHIEFLLVHVMRLFSSGAAATGIDTVIMDETTSVIEELEGIANNLPNPTEVKLLKGSSPANLIVECAKNEACDLIIMGSRGQGGVKGYLGSVSYGVVKESPVTVLIAKEADL